MNYLIDKSEVRRYLGISDIADDKTELLIDECIDGLLSFVRPNYIYKKFEIISSDNELILKEIGLHLTGETAKHRLMNCSHCFILGATLGIEADTKIRIMQSCDMARAVIYDACATDLIEKVCDRAQAEILNYACSDNMNITERFSPGYGDLPLNLQRNICSSLNLDTKLGVTLTNELLLIPTKSVTAFIGAGKNPPICLQGCDICNMSENCRFCKKQRRNKHV